MPSIWRDSRVGVRAAFIGAVALILGALITVGPQLLDLVRTKDVSLVDVRARTADPFPVLEVLLNNPTSAAVVVSRVEMEVTEIRPHLLSVSTSPNIASSASYHMLLDLRSTAATALDLDFFVPAKKPDKIELIVGAKNPGAMTKSQLLALPLSDETRLFLEKSTLPASPFPEYQIDGADVTCRLTLYLDGSKKVSREGVRLSIRLPPHFVPGQQLPLTEREPAKDPKLPLTDYETVRVVRQLRDRSRTPWLKQLSKSSDTATAVEATAALAEFGDGTARARLIGNVRERNGNRWRRILSLRKLVELGMHDRSLYLECLAEQRELALECVPVLGVLREPRAIPGLVALASTIRQVVHDTEKTYNNSDSSVGKGQPAPTERQLNELVKKRGLPITLTLEQDMYVDQAMEDVRASWELEQIVTSLGHFKDQRAVTAIAQIASSPYATREVSYNLYRASLRALASIGHEGCRAIESLAVPAHDPAKTARIAMDEARALCADGHAPLHSATPLIIERENPFHDRSVMFVGDWRGNDLPESPLWYRTDSMQGFNTFLQGVKTAQYGKACSYHLHKPPPQYLEHVYARWMLLELVARSEAENYVAELAEKVPPSAVITKWKALVEHAERHEDDRDIQYSLLRGAVNATWRLSEQADVANASLIVALAEKTYLAHLWDERLGREYGMALVNLVTTARNANAEGVITLTLQQLQTLTAGSRDAEQSKRMAEGLAIATQVYSRRSNRASTYKAFGQLLELAAGHPKEISIQRLVLRVAPDAIAVAADLTQLATLTNGAAGAAMRVRRNNNDDAGLAAVYFAAANAYRKQNRWDYVARAFDDVLELPVQTNPDVKHFAVGVALLSTFEKGPTATSRYTRRARTFLRRVASDADLKPEVADMVARALTTTSSR